MKRIYSLVIVLIMLTSVFTFLPSDARSASVNSISIAGDQFIDNDMDGVYDRVEVTINIDVDTTGMYYIYNYFYNETGTYLAYQYKSISLNAGHNTYTTWMSGVYIYDTHSNGTLNVRVRVYGADSWTFLGDYDLGNTPTSFTYDQFQGPYAWPTGYSHYVEDTDGDGYYNFLVFEVFLHVEKRFYGYVYARFYNETGAYNQYKYYYQWFDPGNYTVPLRFDGIDLNINKANGSYRFRDLTIRDIKEGVVLYQESSYFYATGYYSYQDFQPYPIKLTNSVSWWTEDTDGDGYYDYLNADIGVDVNIEGDYRFLVYVHCSSGYITTVNLYLHLTPADTWITAPIKGQDLFRSMHNGSFYISTTYVYDSNGNMLDRDYTDYYSPAYTYDQFQPPDIMYLSYGGDYPWDDPSDINTKYDSLYLQLRVNVYKEGDYRFRFLLRYQSLGGSTYTLYTSYSDPIHLSPGIQVVDVPVASTHFWRYDYYGDSPPYSWFLQGLTIIDSSNNIIDDNSPNPMPQTNSYDLNDFENYGSITQVTAENQDTNGNGYIDKIRITAKVEIYQPGNYRIKFWMYRLSDNSYIGYYSSSYQYFNQDGIYTISWDINVDYNWACAGDAFYLSEMRLSRGGWGDVYTVPTPYTSDIYPADDLEPPNVVINSVKDHPVDNDGIPGYEYLRFEFQVNCHSQGSYYIQFELYDSDFNYIGRFHSDVQYMAPTRSGEYTMTVDVSGPFLRTEGYIGPYYLSPIQVKNSGGSTVYTTSSYMSDYYELTSLQSGYDTVEKAEISVSPAASNHIANPGDYISGYFSMDMNGHVGTTVDFYPTGDVVAYNLRDNDDVIADTNSNGLVDTKVYPGEKHLIAFLIHIPNTVPEGTVLTAHIYLYWDDMNNYTVFTMNIGVGVAPYTPGTYSTHTERFTTPFPETDVTPSTSGGDETDVTTPTSGTESSGGNLEPGESNLKTRTFRSSDSVVQCTVKYTGSGELSIRYVKDPSGGVRKDGIGIYVDIRAPDTMDVKSVTIVIHYKDSDIPMGVNEKDLSLYYWNEEKGQWIEVPTTVDTEGNTLTATVNHLTIFSAFRATKAVELSNTVGTTLMAVLAIIIIVGIGIVMGSVKGPESKSGKENASKVKNLNNKNSNTKQ